MELTIKNLHVRVVDCMDHLQYWVWKNDGYDLIIHAQTTKTKLFDILKELHDSHRMVG